MNSLKPLSSKSTNDPLTRHYSSRRRFIASAGILTAGAWLCPRSLFAEEENIVLTARKRAETAAITVQPLRGNVTALIGSGGNIAVLTEADGKIVIDSGYATSRARITDILAKMKSGPIKHLVNTHWHFDHTDGNEWMHADAPPISAIPTHEKRLSMPRAWKIGSSLFRHHPPVQFLPKSSIRT